MAEDTEQPADPAVDTEAGPEQQSDADALPEDSVRQPMLELLQSELGDDLLGFHLAAGDDLWVRVARPAWYRAVELCRDRLGMAYFCFLSGLDWKPNPDLLGEKEWEAPGDTSPGAVVAEADEEDLDGEAGAGEAAAAAAGAGEAAAAAGDDQAAAAAGAGEAAAAAGDDQAAAAAAAAPGDEPAPAGAGEEGAGEAAPAGDEEAAGEPAAAGPGYPTGVAGGDTRFQVFARLYNVQTKVGITLKVDLPEDDTRLDTLVGIYRGADWHERETWEMYGFQFTGHPSLRHLYLPLEFEGHPLRKDFPLLARLVKPWPGLVDVEPLPGEADGEGAEPTEATEEV